MSAGWRRRAGTVALYALAVAGAVFALEGGLRGDLRHRLVALALGALCTLPLGVAQAFGARGRRFVARCGLIAAAGALALGLTELCVRALDLRAFRPEVLVDDPVLGHRLLPERGEVDAWGFRNPQFPETAQVVCLGDSQTYGVSVPAEDAWPRALARRTGLTTYNAGLGGYGPLQYVELFERALELEPEVVVVALYLGNDLVDAYTYVALERWSEWRVEGVVYGAPKGRRPRRRSANLALALIDRLRESVRVLDALAARAKRRIDRTSALERVYWGEEGTPGYERGPIATRFTPDYRHAALDLGRPNVAEGLRVTELALARLASRAREEGVRLVLLVLPTKERCYATLMEQHGEPPPEPIARLARAERTVASSLSTTAGALELELVDPAPALVEALAADRPLWPPGPDGHFNAAGNALLAQVVAETLAD